DALGEGTARSSGSGRSRRTRDALVVAEIAVALVLLLGSTLLIRSLVALTRVDTGIDTRNLLTFDVSVSGPRAEYQARRSSSTRTCSNDSGRCQGFVPL